MHYYICTFKLANSEAWYPNPDGLEPVEVLSKITEMDFQSQNKMIVFSDGHLDHVYSHHYVQPPADGITLVKIANRVVDDNDKQFWRKTGFDNDCVPLAERGSGQRESEMLDRTLKKHYSSERQFWDDVCLLSDA